jgi:DNA-binding transcriptional ArsR family regulator
MQKRPPAASNTPEADLEPLVALFRLLSDKTRLNILMLLAGGERNVSSLCDELRLPQPTVSHHLGLLRMSNLITNRRDGKQVFYELDGKVDAATARTLQVSVDRYKVSVAFP